MTAYLVAFLLLVAAGVAALLIGIFILAGTGWMLVATGLVAFAVSIVPYRAFYR